MNLDKSKVNVLTRGKTIGVRNQCGQEVNEGFRILSTWDLSQIDQAGTDGAEWCRKGTCGRKDAGTNWPLVNVRVLRLECAKMLHEGLLFCVLMRGSKTKE